ncbi:MAG: glutamine synthetase family protein, partial [Actinobacteria bacterium]|nr:glutamine synthetase family protein [Actinomycetota bacterium]
PESGYRDLLLRVDPTTFFRMPWQPGTIGVLGDLEFADGTAVTMAPRTVLRRQAKRIETAGYTASLGSELQFTLITPEPATGGNHLASRSARLEPTLHQIRRSLSEMPVEIAGTSGLQGPGQYEVVLLPGDPLQVSDGAVLSRSAIKAIATLEGQRATFMAAPGESAGTGAVNISLRGQRGGSPLADRYGEAGLSEVGKAFVAGLLLHATELCVLYAPNVNSYRRFGSDPFSPSALTWGDDNRTCAVRVVSSESALRIENRIPGSDANPYLTAAATIAAGLDGITHQAKVPPVVSPTADPLPTSLAQAVAVWAESAWVLETFGADVQSHYATMARIEIEAAGASADLDWERERYLDGC